MNEILKRFLDKPISRDVYYIPTEISPKEIDDTLKFLQNKAIENGKKNTFIYRRYHTISGEFLGKGIIIAFEFRGIKGALKFLIDTSIEAEKVFFKEAKESNSLKEMEIEKNSLKDLAKILKDGIENIEKILNEWE